jgi:hypothetical protein
MFGFINRFIQQICFSIFVIVVYINEILKHLIPAIAGNYDFAIGRSWLISRVELGIAA